MGNPKTADGFGFEEFRAMATDTSLSMYEKIGFPDAYRKGFEPQIFRDILGKLTNLELPNQNVLDIGPGCSELPVLVVDQCLVNNSNITLIDSTEMLAHLPSGKNIHKIAGAYPECLDEQVLPTTHFDVILCYSVFHYIFSETGFWRFLDQSLSLLAPQGQLLIGDLPNVSKRKRFFSSSTGIAFHKHFTKSEHVPEIHYNTIEHERIDDSVVFAVLMRARAQGFDAYLMPQSQQLPMSNRREDILIVRP